MSRGNYFNALPSPPTTPSAVVNKSTIAKNGVGTSQQKIATGKNHSTTKPSYFIGWDVGGWYCDINPNSRDAIVILDHDLRRIGEPWRGNLRKYITEATSTCNWIKALFELCKAEYQEGTVTMAIDTPLGFSNEFVNLITRNGYVEPNETSSLNRYLFRHTERHLYKRKLKPLSAVQDMIGSQATKGMHVLAKFAKKRESCGVWTDEEGFFAIETYPTACQNSTVVKELLMRSQKTPVVNISLKVKNLLENVDVKDAHVCAVIAFLFASKSEKLEKPSGVEHIDEGWIWTPLE